MSRARVDLIENFVLVYKPKVPEETLPDLLQRLYEEQYTGSITFHWINGVPKKVEFPGDQVKLVTGGSLSD